MMKKRKNVQFFAAAALTAALVTGQFSFATVMGDSTTSVQASSLIPNNVTIDQPVPLSEISLPRSDYGTLSWVDDSEVPSSRVQTYDVVFRPYNTADLAQISGWDGHSDAIYSSVTVVVSSISNDSDYEGSDNQQNESERTDAGNQESSENTEGSANAEAVENTETTENPSAVESTESPSVTETPEVTEVPEETETPAEADAAEAPASTEITETPEATEVPEETETPEATENPAGESQEATVTPEAEKDNIFDGVEKELTKDERSQTVEADAEPSDEEKAQLAEINHTCNGISVSGINLPWYVQFRVASGDNYEFTNEAEANVFKSYEFELWDLKNNVEYEIPDGEYLSVTVPVKAGYEYTIEHLLDSGAMETIVPSVEGSTMVFSTHSFSPFGIAGSKALVGEEIEEGSYSSGDTSTSTTDSEVTTTPAANITNTADNAANSSSSSDADSTKVTSSQNSVSGNQDSSSDTDSQNETDDSSSVGAVATGDNTPILPFVIIGIAAAVIVAVLVYLKKKK